MAIKNQSLTITYYAWDTANSAGKTGDSANHTIYVSIDGVANAADNSPAEVDSTNLPGMYSIALTAAEMNGNHVMVGGVSATSDIVIVPTSITTERGDLATVDGNVDSILEDTGTTLPNTLSTIDGIVDDILVDTGTTLPTTLTTIEGKVDTVDTNVDAVLVDTGTTLPATLTTMEGKIDTVDTNVDAVLVDTAALNDTALPDSVPADGSLPTLKQAMYMVTQFLLERSVSSTTVTVKKVDGSTSLFTLTLNDANSPTSITRSG